LSGIDDRQHAEVEELNSRLADGLKACRSIVSDYRAIITGQQGAEEGGRDAGREPAAQL
jgi:hypothetical protein